MSTSSSSPAPSGLLRRTGSQGAGGQSALPDISPRWPAMTKTGDRRNNGAAVHRRARAGAVLRHPDRLRQARFADTSCPSRLRPGGSVCDCRRSWAWACARRMSMTGDYLSGRRRAAGRPGHPRWSRTTNCRAPPDRSRPRTRRQQPERGSGIAGAYHRIDESRDRRGWLRPRRPGNTRTSGDDIAANRDAVLHETFARVR